MNHLRRISTIGGLLVLLALAIATPYRMAWAGSALYPIYIPQECVTLAQQEGVPTVIENRYQAVKARLKLARLRSDEPMVAECRAAVKRAEIAVKAMAKAEREGAKFEQAPSQSANFEQTAAAH